MEPFQDLKMEPTFRWSHKLEEAFRRSKDFVADTMAERMGSFNKRKLTHLLMGWTNADLEFCLLQKSCICDYATGVLS
jgi:hypothetical protein